VAETIAPTRLLQNFNGLGPIHLLIEDGTLTWCGVKPQFRHKAYDGPSGHVTCLKCARAIRRGTQTAWRA
jgi:hypothetical protein